MSNRQRSGSQAQRRLAEVRRQQRRQQLRIRALIGGLAGAAVVIVAVVAAILIVNRQASATNTPATGGVAAGATVDGISCSTTEQSAYHIHAHLAIYNGGTAQPLPAGVGIPGPQQVNNGFVVGGKCLYWLHTHDQTGIIHIESPVQRVYTLGNFFDVWGKPLSSSRVGNDQGQVTAFVNGKRFTGDPRSIKLGPHTVIQLDVGSVVPPHPYTFPSGT